MNKTAFTRLFRQVFPQASVAAMPAPLLLLSLFFGVSPSSAQAQGDEMSPDLHFSHLTLADAKKSAQMLKGSVWAEPEVGKGSAFFVRLPVSGL